jgi:hypothetical protein
MRFDRLANGAAYFLQKVAAVHITPQAVFVHAPHEKNSFVLQGGKLDAPAMALGPGMSTPPARTVFWQ